MNRTATPASTILPTEDLVPNSYHQDFHIARWETWLRETPQWIVKMGRENLWVARGEKGHQTLHKEVDEENKENNINRNNVVQKCNCESNVGMKEIEDERHESREQDSEMKEDSKEFRDWSLQLTNSGRLLIIGKTDENTIQRSKDVSFCKRVDANTLLHEDGSVYVLSVMPDHFTNLPYYVRNKFQCGFPDDWKTVKYKWLTYIKRGSPFDFNWTAETDEHVLEETIIEDSTQQSTMCQDETYILVTSPLGINEIAPHRDPVHEHLTFTCKLDVSQSCLEAVENATHSQSIIQHGHDEPHSAVLPKHLKPSNSAHGKFKRSHLTAEQDHAKQSNSLAKQEFFKRPQSTAKQENLKNSRSKVMQEHMKELNVEETEVCRDKVQSNQTPAISLQNASTSVRHSPHVKKSSKPNDIHAAKDVSEAFVNQELILERWTPILVNGSDLKITGFVKSELHAEVSYTTDIVEKRKTNNSFQSKDGITYKLMGTFADPKNTIPSLIKKRLAKGLPAQWKMMIKKLGLIRVCCQGTGSHLRTANATEMRRLKRNLGESLKPNKN